MNEVGTPGFHVGNPVVMVGAKPLLVLGVGNTLLTDDGLGPKVADRLKSTHPDDENISFVDGGTLSFTLAGQIEKHDGLIVVDACELGAEPGTIRVFEGPDMDVHMRSGKRSVHEVALADMLDIARLRECLPGRRALVGVQPSSLDWGLELSQPVAAVFNEACAEVEILITRWRT